MCSHGGRVAPAADSTPSGAPLRLNYAEVVLGILSAPKVASRVAARRRMCDFRSSEKVDISGGRAAAHRYIWATPDTTARLLRAMCPRTSRRNLSEASSTAYASQYNCSSKKSTYSVHIARGSRYTSENEFLRGLMQLYRPRGEAHQASPVVPLESMASITLLSGVESDRTSTIPLFDRTTLNGRSGWRAGNRTSIISRSATLRGP